MVSGASVWPMKMLAATLVDSAPLAPITRCITTAIARTNTCITPKIIEDREQARNEDDDRQHLKSENHRLASAQLIAENEFAAGLRVSDQRVYFVAGHLECRRGRRAQNDKREGELQAHAPQNQPRAVSRAGVWRRECRLAGSRECRVSR